MEETTFRQLLGKENIVRKEHGFGLKASPDWIVRGEDHLSYTTIIRLAECCREYCWSRLLLDSAYPPAPDVICKSVEADFRRPILAGTEIDLSCVVFNFSDKSFRLSVLFIDAGTGAFYAKVTLLLVFYDPEKKKSIPAPQGFYEKLSRLI